MSRRAGTDINGNSLKPQLGEQVELGIKYLSSDMSQQVTASYFHITKKDSIAADPSDPTYRSKIQLGEVRSRCGSRRPMVSPPPPPPPQRKIGM
ncbi:TonB-dependent receptor [Vibrio lentus]|nr:TonB-dependent receptor [Vibrio lentus]